MNNIITIDGADGCGKSTIIEALTKRLQSDNFNVYRHDFPSHGETSGYLVDEYLNGNVLINDTNFKNKAAYMCYATDRMIWANDLIKLFDDPMRLFLFGRSHLSSFMYQFNTLLERKGYIPDPPDHFIKKYIDTMVENATFIYDCEIKDTIFEDARYINIMLTHPTMDIIIDNAKQRIESGEADIHDANLDLQQSVWQFIEDSTKYFTVKNIARFNDGLCKVFIYDKFIMNKVICSFKNNENKYEFYPVDKIVDDIIDIISKNITFPGNIRTIGATSK